MEYLSLILAAICVRLWWKNRDLKFQVEVWNMIADKRMTDEARRDMEEDIESFEEEFGRPYLKATGRL